MLNLTRNMSQGSGSLTQLNLSNPFLSVFDIIGSCVTIFITIRQSGSGILEFELAEDKTYL